MYTAQLSGIAPFIRHSSAAGVKLSPGGYLARIARAEISIDVYFVCHSAFRSCMHRKAKRSAVETGTSQPRR